MASNEALVDASAFLELEKAFSEEKLDGVELAVQAASKPVAQSTLGSAGAGPAPLITTRINQSSLDRIAVAFRDGKLTTFSNIGESLEQSMQALRDQQVEIFHRHMMVDIIGDTKADDDEKFDSKEFLESFQKAHQSKEREMSSIVKSLESLSKKLSDMNSNLGTPMAIPSDPLVQERGPKISFKQAGLKVVEQQRNKKLIERERIHDMVEDAMVHDLITHGHNKIQTEGLRSGVNEGAPGSPEKSHSAPNTPKLNDQRPSSAPDPSNEV